jgi:hypothetical protein
MNRSKYIKCSTLLSDCHRAKIITWTFVFEVVAEYNGLTCNISSEQTFTGLLG